MPGYVVKAILVNIDDIAAVLGSGNDALGSEILADKKHKKHFKLIDSKRPFVFVTTKPGVHEESVIEKKCPTMETCVHQLLRTDGHDDMIEHNSDDGNSNEGGSADVATTTSDDNDNDHNKLDERTGYKYLYALEAIALRCGGRYLFGKHWEDFRMGYIGDVQLKAFKQGFDLELTHIFDRGVPPQLLKKKKIPKVVDYPLIGYLPHKELAAIVEKLMPENAEQELVTDGDHYTTDATEAHLAEALAEFQGWIQKSIVESKDLLFFTYHD
jgi:hypothetical protein